VSYSGTPRSETKSLFSLVNNVLSDEGWRAHGRMRNSAKAVNCANACCRRIRVRFSPSPRNGAQATAPAPYFTASPRFELGDRAFDHVANLVDRSVEFFLPVEEFFAGWLAIRSEDTCSDVTLIADCVVIAAWPLPDTVDEFVELLGRESRSSLTWQWSLRA
jgi:hypothetical protein